MATMTNTTGAVFIPAQWAKEAELARDKAYVVADLVQRKHEDVADSGNLIHVPFVGNLANADDVTAGTAVTPVAPTETEVQIALNKHKAKAVQISDKLKRQSKYNLSEVYGTQIGKVLARAVDTDVLVEIVAGSTNSAIQTASSTAATYAQIVSAVTKLDSLDVPMEDRSWVVNGVLMGDLRQMAEFTRYDAIGSQNPSVAKSSAGALVGFIYGIPVHLSNNTQLDGGTPNRNQNVLFQKDAVALVVQKTPTMEHDRTSLNLADDIIGSMIYGTKTLRPDHSQILARG